MKLPVLLLLSMLIAAVGAVAGRAADAPQSGALNEDLIIDWDARIAACRSAGGTWLHGHNECERIDEAACGSAGGHYYPCASACRHRPDNLVCIAMCVPMCGFAG